MQVFLEYPFTIPLLLFLFFGFLFASLWRKPLAENIPGPKGIPFLGNIRDIVFERECEVYTEWSKTYGDVIGLKIFGMSIVYLNSQRAAHDLLDIKSSIYSDRFITPMMRLMGLADWPVVIMQYGSQWRKHRQLFHERFNARAAEEFWPLHEKATERLLYSLLTAPHDFSQHFKHLGGSVLIESTYGISVSARDHPLLDLADEAIAAFTEISKPGAFLVDIFPILRVVPEWFPFAYFKRRAAFWKSRLNDLRDIPWKTVKESLNSGKAKNCFATTMMSQIQEQGADITEYDLKGAAGTTYGAGTETILTCLETFLLAMVLHPEVQALAQQELDTIVGAKRLPAFTDRPSLPYVEALFKEVLRWNPPAPLGVPHRLIEDDIYKGFLIPKGSIVFANAWAMLRDESTFQDAHKFLPERYVDNPDLFDPKTSGVFGFGRRICPGRFLADALVWLAMTRILASFNIHKELDNLGKEVVPELQFTSGFTRRPLPFKCRMTPRSTSKAAMIVCLKDQDNGFDQ